MKYAGKTFTLYASQPVAIQGSDSLYTYQNTGTGTATIVGSNNAVNWTSVATVVSGASYTGSHAYAFLMMTGSTEVSVSRGAAGDNSFSSSNPLPVGGKSVQKSASFTRPADTTAYAANDAVANSTSTPTLLSFANCANANGGQGYIVKTQLLTNQKTCTARFRLSFYHTAPSPVNDNAPKPMLYANKDKLIGRIDLDPCNTEDTTSDAAFTLSTALMPYVCAAADTTIYCILTTLDAFTPASAQQFFLEITCELS